jgi:hypothetical protein
MIFGRVERTLISPACKCMCFTVLFLNKDLSLWAVDMTRVAACHPSTMRKFPPVRARV